MVGQLINRNLIGTSSIYLDRQGVLLVCHGNEGLAGRYESLEVRRLRGNQKINKSEVTK